MSSTDQTVAALTGRSYSFSELLAVSGATRREISDWVGRGIISAEPSPGSGRHREYFWQNLVEAVAAKGISGHLRAGTIEEAFQQIRGLMATDGISWVNLTDRELYPDGVAFLVLFDEDQISFVVIPLELPEGGETGWGTQETGYLLEINLSSIAANTLSRATSLGLAGFEGTGGEAA